MLLIGWVIILLASANQRGSPTLVLLISIYISESLLVLPNRFLEGRLCQLFEFTKGFDPFLEYMLSKVVPSP